ncbi:hypothetical protein JOF59_003434 [Streptomyces clavifer]|uniref:Uncharacterized protein n=1 Tax=Streptomyces clavifer TaxID=68188 RepID=A0ABS4VAU0_9ACTN|nr:hypothetical protein [Streptomyces clavifer]
MTTPDTTATAPSRGYGGRPPEEHSNIRRTRKEGRR